MTSKKSDMVTIFTPVYNRAYIIENLYNSLKRQTNKNFEWVVIDDGSTDNIKELFAKWVNEDNGFKIIFKSVKNRGKHCAINEGVKIASGESFFIVDSDDFITDDAVEFVLSKFSEIIDDDRFAGISGLRANLKGEIHGGIPKISGEYVDARNYEREEYSLLGDKAEVYKTEILGKYPFPEYDDENFMPETVVWDDIGYAGYMIRWYNKVITICDYLDDGLTRNIYDVYEKNPKGLATQIRVYKKHIENLDARKKYYDSAYGFYERHKSRFTKNEMIELLNLSNEDFCLFDGIYNENIDIIRNELKCYGCNEVVLYGYGIRGRRFSKMLSDMNIRVKYVIDKNWKSFKGVEAYSLDDELPIGNELVIVTVKNEADEIRAQIIKKYPDKNVIITDKWVFKSINVDTVV